MKKFSYTVILLAFGVVVGPAMGQEEFCFFSRLAKYNTIHPIKTARHFADGLSKNARLYDYDLVAHMRYSEGVEEFGNPKFAIKKVEATVHGRVLTDSLGRKYLVQYDSIKLVNSRSGQPSLPTSNGYVERNELVYHLTNGIGKQIDVPVEVFDNSMIGLLPKSVKGDENANKVASEILVRHERRKEQIAAARETFKSIPKILFMPAVTVGAASGRVAFRSLRWGARQVRPARFVRPRTKPDKRWLQRNLMPWISYAALMMSGYHPADILEEAIEEEIDNQLISYGDFVDGTQNEVKVEEGDRILVVDSLDPGVAQTLLRGTFSDGIERLYGANNDAIIAEDVQNPKSFSSLQKAAEDVGPFKHVDIILHGTGDGKGVLIGNTIVTQYPEELKKLVEETRAPRFNPEIPDEEQLLPAVVDVELLPKTKGLLAPGGTVRFISCGAGAGECGQELLTALTRKLSDQEVKVISSTRTIESTAKDWGRKTREMIGGDPGDFLEGRAAQKQGTIEKHMLVAPKTILYGFIYGYLITHRPPKESEIKIFTVDPKK